MPNDFNEFTGDPLPIQSPTKDLGYPIPTPSLQVITPLLYKIPSEPSDDAGFSSYLGTPVYSNLIFEKFQPAIGDFPTGNEPDGSLRIDTVLFIVNQKKNIIRHEIPGRSGTIKTYISMGDYEIQIAGAIVGPYANQLPKDEILALIKICELPQGLKVSSQFLSHFGIDTIVIDDYTISEKMGSRNEIPFNIFAFSDINSDIDTTGYNWQIK